jgi:hypothetical protein
MTPASRRSAKRGPKSKLEHSEHLLDQIRALGRIQATVAETASVLRCSERTLQSFFTKHPDAKEAHEDGKLEGCASLRRKQFALADKNAAMAIFLGKQYLGQRDQAQVTHSPDMMFLRILDAISNGMATSLVAEQGQSPALRYERPAGHA